MILGVQKPSEDRQCLTQVLYALDKSNFARQKRVVFGQSFIKLSLSFCLQDMLEI
jgi:hypothetical protein